MFVFAKKWNKRIFENLVVRKKETQKEEKS